jgi:predicted Na+-dependent transporter
MTITDLLTVIAQVSLVLFVVTSMLAMGMSLTIPMILKPLKNVRLVVLALVANFVLIPLLVYVINLVIPLAQPLQIGLLVMATAAGAPFLPKLVQAAQGDIAFAVGLMVLLMVVTIIYVPLVLPLLLPGVTVNPWNIAQSLIVLMLIPLAIGLLIRSHSPDVAAEYAPVMNKTSTIAVLVLFVVALGLSASDIIGLVGSGGIFALLIFIIGSLLIGYLVGGRDPAIRSVTGLGTAFRNQSAVLVVVGANFANTDTLPFVLVGSVLMLLITLPAAKRFGARAVAGESGQPALSAQ